MKKILLFLFIIFAFDKSFGQNINHGYDSILQRCLTRYIQHPDYQNKIKSGFAILTLSKADSSIKISTVYVSDKMFELINQNLVTNKINEICNNKINNPFKLIVPVYFFFNQERKLSKKLQKIAINKLSHLEKLGYTITKFPVNISIYEMIN